MAITDMLNRRVRALPDDEDDIYSEQSDMGEEPSQDEPEEEYDSDAEDQLSNVRYILQSSGINPLTRLLRTSHKMKAQRTTHQTQPQTQRATTMPPKPSQTKTPPTKTTSKPP